MAEHAEVYLLRTVMICGVCGLHYGGTPGRDGISWYRCNGQLTERGRIEGRCPGKSVRSDWLEPIVWGDIERFLWNPGDVIDEINLDQEQENQRAVIEAERITLQKALEGLAERRRRAVDLHVRSRIEDANSTASNRIERPVWTSACLNRRLAGREPGSRPNLEAYPTGFAGAPHGAPRVVKLLVRRS
jgi:hypothetical protein